MTTDQKLLDTDIPATISKKLEEIAIGSVRQLYARLRSDSHRLQDYLQLSDDEFTKFYKTIETIVRDEYPQDLLPSIRPQVNKTGVAVHRLRDPMRPKYKKRTQS